MHLHDITKNMMLLNQLRATKNLTALDEANIALFAEQIAEAQAAFNARLVPATTYMNGNITVTKEGFVVHDHDTEEWFTVTEFLSIVETLQSGEVWFDEIGDELYTAEHLPAMEAALTELSRRNRASGVTENMVEEVNAVWEAALQECGATHRAASQARNAYETYCEQYEQAELLRRISPEPLTPENSVFGNVTKEALTLLKNEYFVAQDDATAAINRKNAALLALTASYIQ